MNKDDEATYKELSQCVIELNTQLLLKNKEIEELKQKVLDREHWYRDYRLYLSKESNKHTKKALIDRIDKAKTRISLIQMEDSTNKETREVLNDLLNILRGEDNE